MKIFCALLVAAAGLTLPAQAELVNAVKAVVHDAVVTQFEVEYNAEAVVDGLRRQYRNQPDVFQRELYKALNEIMEERLKRQLILHDFKAGGYNIPEPILESAIQEEVDRRGGREKLTKALQAQGRTFEKFRQQTRESIIMSALRAKNISQELIISPHRIEAYYLANQDKYKVGEQVKLRRIMLNSSSDSDAAATRKLADEIRAKIKDGAAFSEMAAVYSQSTDRRDGGLWGWHEKSGLAPELANVAFSLKPGEVSEAVPIGNAYFILFVEDKRTAHSKALSEVRNEIEATLLTEERARLEKQWIERLKKKTFVRYF